MPTATKTPLLGRTRAVELLGGNQAGGLSITFWPELLCQAESQGQAVLQQPEEAFG